MIETGLISARFLHYAALVLLFGGWAYAGFSQADVALSRRLNRLIVGAALLVLIGSVAVLGATVAGLGGSFETLADTSLWATIINETDFGRIWTVRLVMACLSVGVAIFWSLGHSTVARVLGLALAGALLVTVAWTGHGAIGEGLPGQVHRWADAIHLVAAAVWLGALMPLFWLLAREENTPGAARHLTHFHAIGLAAVLTLIATGLVKSFFLVGDPGVLFTTRYGQLLTLKLVLFAGMIGLAARNRLHHIPGLMRAISSHADPSVATAILRRSISYELTLGFVVLAIVAVLGASEPAASV